MRSGHTRPIWKKIGIEHDPYQGSSSRSGRSPSPSHKIQKQINTSLDNAVDLPTTHKKFSIDSPNKQEKDNDPMAQFMKKMQEMGLQCEQVQELSEQFQSSPRRSLSKISQPSEKGQKKNQSREAAKMNQTGKLQVDKPIMRETTSEVLIDQPVSYHQQNQVESKVRKISIQQMHKDSQNTIKGTLNKYPQSQLNKSQSIRMRKSGSKDYFEMSIRISQPIDEFANEIESSRRQQVNYIIFKEELAESGTDESVLVENSVFSDSQENRKIEKKKSEFRKRLQKIHQEQQLEEIRKHNLKIMDEQKQELPFSPMLMHSSSMRSMPSMTDIPEIDLAPISPKLSKKQALRKLKEQFQELKTEVKRQKVQSNRFINKISASCAIDVEQIIQAIETRIKRQCQMKFQYILQKKAGEHEKQKINKEQEINKLQEKLSFLMSQKNSKNQKQRHRVGQKELKNQQLSLTIEKLVKQNRQLQEHLQQTKEQLQRVTFQKQQIESIKRQQQIQLEKFHASSSRNEKSSAIDNTQKNSILIQQQNMITKLQDQLSAINQKYLKALEDKNRVELRFKQQEINVRELQKQVAIFAEQEQQKNSQRDYSKLQGLLSQLQEQKAHLELIIEQQKQVIEELHEKLRSRQFPSERTQKGSQTKIQQAFLENEKLKELANLLQAKIQKIEMQNEYLRSITSESKKLQRKNSGRKRLDMQMLTIEYQKMKQIISIQNQRIRKLDEDNAALRDRIDQISIQGGNKSSIGYTRQQLQGEIEKNKLLSNDLSKQRDKNKILMVKNQDLCEKLIRFQKDLQEINKDYRQTVNKNVWHQKREEQQERIIEQLQQENRKCEQQIFDLRQQINNFDVLLNQEAQGVRLQERQILLAKQQEYLKRIQTLNDQIQLINNRNLDKQMEKARLQKCLYEKQEQIVQLRKFKQRYFYDHSKQQELEISAEYHQRSHNRANALGRYGDLDSNYRKQRRDRKDQNDYEAQNSSFNSQPNGENAKKRKQMNPNTQNPVSFRHLQQNNTVRQEKYVQYQQNQNYRNLDQQGRQFYPHSHMEPYPQIQTHSIPHSHPHLQHPPPPINFDAIQHVNHMNFTEHQPHQQGINVFQNNPQLSPIGLSTETYHQHPQQYPNQNPQNPQHPQHQYPHQNPYQYPVPNPLQFFNPNPNQSVKQNSTPRSSPLDTVHHQYYQFPMPVPLPHPYPYQQQPHYNQPPNYPYVPPIPLEENSSNIQHPSHYGLNMQGQERNGQLGGQQNDFMKNMANNLKAHMAFTETKVVTNTNTQNKYLQKQKNEVIIQQKQSKQSFNFELENPRNEYFKIQNQPKNYIENTPIIMSYYPQQQGRINQNRQSLAQKKLTVLQKQQQKSASRGIIKQQQNRNDESKISHKNRPKQSNILSQSIESRNPISESQHSIKEKEQMHDWKAQMIKFQKQKLQLMEKQFELRKIADRNKRYEEQLLEKERKMQDNIQNMKKVMQNQKKRQQDIKHRRQQESRNTDEQLQVETLRRKLKQLQQIDKQKKKSAQKKRQKQRYQAPNQQTNKNQNKDRNFNKEFSRKHQIEIQDPFQFRNQISRKKVIEKEQQPYFRQKQYLPFKRQKSKQKTAQKQFSTDFYRGQTFGSPMVVKAERDRAINYNAQPNYQQNYAEKRFYKQNKQKQIPKKGRMNSPKELEDEELFIERKIRHRQISRKLLDSPQIQRQRIYKSKSIQRDRDISPIRSKFQNGQNYGYSSNQLNSDIDEQENTRQRKMSAYEDYKSPSKNYKAESTSKIKSKNLLSRDKDLQRYTSYNGKSIQYISSNSRIDDYEAHSYQHQNHQLSNHKLNANTNDRQNKMRRFDKEKQLTSPKNMKLGKLDANGKHIQRKLDRLKQELKKEMKQLKQ